MRRAISFFHLSFVARAFADELLSHVLNKRVVEHMRDATKSTFRVRAHYASPLHFEEFDKTVLRKPSNLVITPFSAHPSVSSVPPHPHPSLPRHLGIKFHSTLNDLVHGLSARKAGTAAAAAPCEQSASSCSPEAMQASHAALGSQWRLSASSRTSRRQVLLSLGGSVLPALSSVAGESKEDMEAQVETQTEMMQEETKAEEQQEPLAVEDEEDQVAAAEEPNAGDVAAQDSWTQVKRATTPSLEPCCAFPCSYPNEKFFSIDRLNNRCGECCVQQKDLWVYRIFEPEMNFAPGPPGLCEYLGYTRYDFTDVHGAGPFTIEVDLYAPGPPNNQLGLQYDLPGILMRGPKQIFLDLLSDLERLGRFRSDMKRGVQ
eukprot:gnl/MRDRNA2_/MRDRNA2_200226_c0_seq1.p1 gnl/MRDRNA2_/MRDRNA2_200226_c0~~gnl/MRDRNA2_/MRDRNA2_200226_c0_seq1.p1  ORF type:complete len:374 (+),score=55.04 gnl/MRDRNA2_/MRDRNA2_200226_c0_seq1:193-1314(+)